MMKRNQERLQVNMKGLEGDHKIYDQGRRFYDPVRVDNREKDGHMISDVIETIGGLTPISPVTWNTLLEAAAQRHSNDMTNNNWFSHYGTDGSSPWDRIREAGYYPMLSGGENIAAGYSTVLSVIEGWLKSPGHCANIMSPYFREIGAS